MRNKSNFVVLESEENKETSEDKFNCMDMLAEHSKGELIIIEVQNNCELDYFHRMLYGASKATTDYINKEMYRSVYRRDKRIIIHTILNLQSFHSSRITLQISLFYYFWLYLLILYIYYTIIAEETKSEYLLIRKGYK